MLAGSTERLALWVWIVQWWGAGLAIGRLRFRFPTGALGELSSPELTFCADSYSVSVPPPVIRQWHVKDPGHSAKMYRWQVTGKHAYALEPMKSRPGLILLSRHSTGICQGKRAHTQLVRKRSSTVRVSLLNHGGLIPATRVELVGASSSPRKKKKKKRKERAHAGLPPDSSHARKKPPPPFGSKSSCKKSPNRFLD